MEGDFEEENEEEEEYRDTDLADDFDSDVYVREDSSGMTEGMEGELTVRAYF